MPIRFTISVAALALASACSQTAEAPPAADPEAVLAEIHAVEQAQSAAFAQKDVDAALAPYAADAVFVGPGEAPVSGDGIRAEFEAMLSDKNAALTLTPAASWVAASGDLAVTSATWDFTTTGADGQPSVAHGTNQSVWKKQDDGSWKMVADFNGPVAAAAE